MDVDAVSANVATAGVDVTPVVLPPPPPPHVPRRHCGGLAVGMDVARSTLMCRTRRGRARCVVVDVAGLDVVRLDGGVMLLWAVTWHARMVGWLTWHAVAGPAGVRVAR